MSPMDNIFILRFSSHHKSSTEAKEYVRIRWDYTCILNNAQNIQFDLVMKHLSTAFIETVVKQEDKDHTVH